MAAPRIYAFADEASPRISEQIVALRRNRLCGLEIRNVDGENVSGISLKKAAEVRRKLDDAGLIMVQFFAEGVKARAEWERQMEKEQKAG